MSSSSSSYGQHFRYDVFLSFRGEDTRDGFTSFLHSALTENNIITFMDDKLTKGAVVRNELCKAIRMSRISIVVISENYTDSRWCLDELAEIMECHRRFRQVVLPVFHYVEPSYVRHHRGAFGVAFQRRSQQRSYIEDADYLFQVWRRALRDAANLAGWHLKSKSEQYHVIQRIVQDVLQKLDNASLSITDYPVGLQSRAQDVIRLLKAQPRTACTVLGIWGMGGSGKSTLAKVIYNQIHREFSDKSFLADIREAWGTNRGQIDLQEQLLRGILKVKKMKIHSIEWGKAMIKKTLSGTTALLVLDDVNKDEQLQALCRSRTWICPGSVVIITTRDVRVLDALTPDHVIRTKEMDESESLELFSFHAFKKERPRDDFIKLSKQVVSHCGGLPLALEVLGSYLHERTKQEWTSVLSKIEMIPNDRVQEKLRISFDGLSDDMERGIFLDICFFFIGKERTYVTKILDGCGLYAEIGITVLIERSLIKVEKNNKLGMHDLLRDMGREIVRERSPEEPEKRSHLWFHDDVLDVLTEHTATKTIEGLTLKLPRSSSVRISTKAFEKMKRLRLLQFDQVQLDGDYGHLPNHLKWVYWAGFPLKCTPDNFYPKNVVAIDLRHSNLKIAWKEPQFLERLKYLNLSHSMCLTNTPDFSKLPNLEKLILKDCPSLSKVPFSIVKLKSIGYISLCGYEGLPCDVFPSLIWSWMSPALNPLSSIHSFGGMSSSLVSMDIHSRNLGDLSSMLSSLSKLRSVWVQCRSECQLTQDFRRILDELYDVNVTAMETYTLQISRHPLRSLLIGMGIYYQVINTLSNSISQGLNACGSSDIILPGDNYPCWSAHIGEGHSLLFEVPQVSHCHPKGMILCVIYSSNPENTADECLIGVLIVNYTKCFIQLYKRDTVSSLKDEEWQDIVSNLAPHDKVEIFVVFGHGLTVQKTALYLIFGESTDRKMEASPKSMTPVSMLVNN